MTTVSVLGILLGLALLISSMGFRRMVLFISAGYAFSIAAMGLVTLWIFREGITLLAMLHLLLMMAWGLRLGTFVLRREAQPSFQAKAQETADSYSSARLPAQFAIWISVSVLYVMMFIPALVNAQGLPGRISPWMAAAELLGLLIMAGGLGIEALADRQKSAFKARFPKSFCNVGLYRWSRCPNYLGEILFWVGNWVMGALFLAGPWLWIASVAGLASIVLIMLGSTRRLEMDQEQRYGHLPEFQRYASTVPVLFPGIPVYSLKNLKVYLG
jgi:steroid 5-alpha reductase family enzyme